MKVIANRTMNEAAKEVRIGEGGNNKKITNFGVNYVIEYGRGGDFHPKWMCSCTVN